ncbi:hypothetical protein RhiJN_14853 [Ceratobasidium sp. AG-Ba]|nr:hypothetical protein RhiJN_14853 [Ceratobasidium sp. AG-Ba]
MSQISDPNALTQGSQQANAGQPAISRRRKQRIVDRIVNEKAVEIDKNLKASIELAAEEIGVPAVKLSQCFAVVAPIGEQRKEMWWNGLISDQAEKWKNLYNGPPKGYLTWVAKKISDEEDTSQFTDKQKAEFAARIAKKREEGRAAKAAEIRIHEECMNTKAGVEFVLFVTRGEVNDDLDPFYASSSKAATFLQGHMTVPPKDLLTLMDRWSTGNTAGASTGTGKRTALRQAVRLKLFASYCSILQSLGHDTSKIKHIQYTHYDRIVYTFKVVLRGYPLERSGEDSSI